MCLCYRSKPVSVVTEDDVLHLDAKELPTFGNILTPSDSERFVQFLTAPYIRIPLLLDFFANGDPSRLSALKSKSLQMIVDAALFEPGRWKPADFTDFIDEVPVVDIDRLEAILATSHGSLFNEIAKSPDVLTSCVLKILGRALDMDVGRYTKKSSSGPLILYAIRLAVRLEGFLKYALKKCVPGQPRPRGLETLDNIKVEAAMKRIRVVLGMLYAYVIGAHCLSNLTSSTQTIKRFQPWSIGSILQEAKTWTPRVLLMLISSIFSRTTTTRI